MIFPGAEAVCNVSYVQKKGTCFREKETEILKEQIDKLNTSIAKEEEKAADERKIKAEITKKEPKVVKEKEPVKKRKESGNENGRYTHNTQVYYTCFQTHQWRSGRQVKDGNGEGRK